MARPLLAALRPELGAMCSKARSGAVRRPCDLLTAIPFAPATGVEIGILIDTYDRIGLGSIALEVNLGVRAHRESAVGGLGEMSRQVIATLMSRCGIQ